MEKTTRINFILNGKRELSGVVDNLKRLFESEDPMLLISKSGLDEAKNVFFEKLGKDEKWFDENVYHAKFNEVDYDKIKSYPTKKVYLIKTPNSLYHTISTAYNDGLKFVDSTGIARFVHVFADDCKIVSENYNPLSYEWFMSNFSVPFVMDSKLNQGNYAFKKYSPRFVFMSREYLPQPVSFVQYESKDHFIVDRDEMKFNFDEKVKRLYVPELVIRLRKEGLLKHTSFYPDPVLEQWVKRDERCVASTDANTFIKEYSEDERYIKEVLKSSIAIENAVDPLIKEMVDVIKNRLSKSGAEDEKGVKS